MNNRDILNISFVEFLKGLASSLALPSLALTLALGCDGHPSANLTAPPPSYQTDFKKGATIEIEYNPKLDVLFIIDNSKSMENEQAALIEAMDRFVDSFGENSLVDFRVGAISVFDSRKRALFQAQGLCRPEGTEKVEGDGKVECYPNGRLRAPFVSRDTGTKESLRQALQIGTLDTKDGGPRFEEIFSSILAAFNPEMNRENGNFIREDSRVVVIIVTDEGDLSPQLGVESFLAELKHLIEPDRLDLYGVLAASVDCDQERFSARPTRILQAIGQFHGSTAGRVFPICRPSFGEYLAQIGNDVQRRFRPIEIKLASTPQEGTLKLYYGQKQVEPGPGWSYNPETETISINDQIILPLPYSPNLQFSVDYTRVEKDSIRLGRAKAI